MSVCMKLLVRRGTSWHKGGVMVRVILTLVMGQKCGYSQDVSLPHTAAGRPGAVGVHMCACVAWVCVCACMRCFCNATRCVCSGGVGQW